MEQTHLLAMVKDLANGHYEKLERMRSPQERYENRLSQIKNSSLLIFTQNSSDAERVVDEILSFGSDQEKLKCDYEANYDEEQRKFEHQVREGINLFYDDLVSMLGIDTIVDCLQRLHPAVYKRIQSAGQESKQPNDAKRRDDVELNEARAGQRRGTSQGSRSRPTRRSQRLKAAISENSIGSRTARRSGTATCADNSGSKIGYKSSEKLCSPASVQSQYGQMLAVTSATRTTDSENIQQSIASTESHPDRLSETNPPYPVSIAGRGASVTSDEQSTHGDSFTAPSQSLQLLPSLADSINESNYTSEITSSREGLGIGRSSVGITTRQYVDASSNAELLSRGPRLAPIIPNNDQPVRVAGTIIFDKAPANRAGLSYADWADEAPRLAPITDNSDGSETVVGSPPLTACKVSLSESGILRRAFAADLVGADTISNQRQSRQPVFQAVKALPKTQEGSKNKLSGWSQYRAQMVKINKFEQKEIDDLNREKVLQEGMIRGIEADNEKLESELRVCWTKMRGFYARLSQASGDVQMPFEVASSSSMLTEAADGNVTPNVLKP